MAKKKVVEYLIEDYFLHLYLYCFPLLVGHNLQMDSYTINLKSLSRGRRRKIERREAPLWSSFKKETLTKKKIISQRKIQKWRELIIFVKGSLHEKVEKLKPPSHK